MLGSNKSMCCHNSDHWLIHRWYIDRRSLVYDPTTTWINWSSQYGFNPYLQLGLNGAHRIGNIACALNTRENKLLYPLETNWEMKFLQNYQ